MNRSPLGRTGYDVSRLSFGASALGGVYGPVDDRTAIDAVHAALDSGISYFDVAPAYGGTTAEVRLGRALRGVRRDRYVISTKVGKYSSANGSGRDALDYSRDRIRSSIAESEARLGCGHIDIVHLHDIEYEGRRYVDWALGEGLDTLHELKREGRIGAVGIGIYPMDLWGRVLGGVTVDVALVHNHYCLHDTGLLQLLPAARERGIGLINGAPLASGLLTDAGPPDWHPADAEARAVFRDAAAFCRAQGTDIGTLALQFASQHPDIPTTLFSAATREQVDHNIRNYDRPYDRALVAAVQRILEPVRTQQWSY